MIGQAFILSAPAGTGKTTMVKRLTRELDHVVKSTSYTTRTKRESEEQDKDYHFISYQQFDLKIQSNEFLEYAKVFEHFYGTCQKDVQKLLDSGLDVVLVIDTQGALALKKFFKGVYIFMSPPSIEELKNRLSKRGTENEAELELRLSWAKEEMEKAKHYDYHIVNNDLEETYQALKSIFIAERSKINKL